MNNADLAEIRALLQANTPSEPRPRAPLLGALRSLLAAPAAQARPSMPPPRRVGLRSADLVAVGELMLSQSIADDPGADAGLESAADARRRRAFGQRQEAASDPLPILRLAAPQPAPLDDADVEEVLRRRALRLVPAAPPPAETPYHPEDLSDTMEGRAEQIYANAGLFEPHPVAQSVETGPERALLLRLERLFLAEEAALDLARNG